MAAAEDDGEDLNILVKQKLSRPVYARVSSNELTRAPEEVEQSRRAILEILGTLNVTILRFENIKKIIL